MDWQSNVWVYPTARSYTGDGHGATRCITAAMSRSLLILPTDAFPGGPFELIAVFHFHERIRFNCGLSVERLGLEERCKMENHKSSRVAVRDGTAGIFSSGIRLLYS